MKYQENIAQLVNLKPDFLGFIYYDKSARFVGDQIFEVPQEIKKVGVFVDASIDYIKTKVKEQGLQLVQLHGSETADFCKALKAYFKSALSPKIIKAFSIDAHFNFESLNVYNEVCDYYLFDTRSALPGGSGMTFDWQLLEKYHSTKPYFLSGGLGLEQLENLKLFQEKELSKYCYSLDVNSRFEIKPGFKNLEKLKEFKNSI